MSVAPLFPAVKRLLRWQALVMVVAAGIAYMLGGEQAARSSLLGGLTAFLPNAYFAMRVGGAKNNKTAQEIVRGFYVGEALKLFATAVLFGLVLHLPNIALVPLFVTFIAVLTVFWFALLLNDNQ